MRGFDLVVTLPLAGQAWNDKTRPLTRKLTVDSLLITVGLHFLNFVLVAPREVHDTACASLIACDFQLT